MSEASPPALPERSLLSVLGEQGVVQRSACAAFAWAVTVAPAAFSAAGGPGARVAAVLALILGLLGPTLVPLRKPLGRHVGISAFLLACLLSWILASPALEPGRLDVIRAIIGSLAWGLFTFSWGEPWRLRNEAAQDDAGGTLRARSQLQPAAVPIVALGVLAGLFLLGLAWTVVDPTRALLAHSAAAVGAVSVVGASAAIAVSRGKKRHLHSSLPRATQQSLVALLLAAVVAVVFLYLRRR